MSTSPRWASPHTIEMIESVRAKGVHLWAEEGELRYRAPKGALTQSELRKLREMRREITQLLEEPRSSQLAHTTIDHNEAPLSFSQLAHWHRYDLANRHAIRQIASATRLHGRLNVRALQRGFAEVIHRHAALRTRVIVRNGAPAQEVLDARDAQVSLTDLSAIPADIREKEIHRCIDQLILQPVDLATDPLLAAHLLKLDDDEHVLILAMEHLISDLYSLGLLLRDLFSAYAQADAGVAIDIPTPSVQFADYARRQRLCHGEWLAKHGGYWRQRLAGARRLRFPAGTTGELPQTGWGSVPVQIDQELRAQLLVWSRAQRTTLVMAVLTAYAALVLRWCDAADAVLQFQSDGRDKPGLQNTIGYFASVLFLRVSLAQHETFSELVKQVTREYSLASEHGDYCYFASQTPRPSFARNPGFNWVPISSRADVHERLQAAGTVSLRPVPFAHPMMNIHRSEDEPSIMLFDTGETVFGDLYFPRNRFPAATMQQFVQNLLRFLRELSARPDARVTDLPLA